MVQTSHKTRVLVVEDDAPLRRAMSRVLSSDGYDVTQASDGAEAIGAIGRQTFDVVVSDIRMPQMSGLELLTAIRAINLELPVILLTGTPTSDGADEARRFGAMNYLTKPVEPPRLLNAVARAGCLGRVAQAKRVAMEVTGSALAMAGDRTGLELCLNRALETLFVHYQPIVRVKDKGLYGHEALMRCKEGALPNPPAILDAAERLDRIWDVGRCVRNVAVQPYQGTQRSDALFVNLHATELNDPELAASDSPIVRMGSRSVVLEITERATLEKVDAPQRRIAMLKEAGFRIAIDDLGAGYAGLSSFVELEPDIVKIDMSLVRGIDTNPTKQTLTRSMIHACRDMGVLVVAEGVETVAERDCLTDMQCDLLQGYLFARPGPAFPPVAW